MSNSKPGTQNRELFLFPVFPSIRRNYNPVFVVLQQRKPIFVIVGQLKKIGQMFYFEVFKILLKNRQDQLRQFFGEAGVKK